MTALGAGAGPGTGFPFGGLVLALLAGTSLAGCAFLPCADARDVTIAWDEPHIHEAFPPEGFFGEWKVDYRGPDWRIASKNRSYGDPLIQLSAFSNRAVFDIHGKAEYGDEELQGMIEAAFKDLNLGTPSVVVDHPEWRRGNC